MCKILNNIGIYTKYFDLVFITNHKDVYFMIVVEYICILNTILQNSYSYKFNVMFVFRPPASHSTTLCHPTNTITTL